MRRHLLTLILASSVACATALVLAALAVAQSPTATAPSDFEFKLGFRALADRMPETVGQPLEDERGDNEGTLQRTTTGMMLWRRADNWTGFTDGSRTWILGPFGLAVRGNEERFAWEAHPPLTFDDPFGYCTAVGTIDRPDSRYTGPVIASAALPSLLAAFPGTIPEAFRPGNTFFRCFEGRVLACTVGANLNCGLADASRQPKPGMTTYCQDNPESDFIPLAVAGHEGVFAWQCRNGQPVIERQVFTVDPRGFVSEFWQQLSPPGGKE